VRQPDRTTNIVGEWFLNILALTEMSPDSAKAAKRLLQASKAGEMAVPQRPPLVVNRVAGAAMARKEA
jgi:hypothetical protein